MSDLGCLIMVLRAEYQHLRMAARDVSAMTNSRDSGLANGAVAQGVSRGVWFLHARAA